MLGGIVFAVLKVLQSRQSSVEAVVERDRVPPWPAPGPRWPPLEETVPPSPSRPAPTVEQEPAASENAPPARKAPPAKKASPAKKAAAKKKVAPRKAAKAAAPKKVAPIWVDPDGNICPKSHPVKAKLSSRIFQVPGMFAYERTNPDRCYQDADAAAGDGFRAAKR